MTAHDDLARRLQRIAKVSYGATIDEARDVSRALNEAVAVIEQQADRIAALTANCGLLAASLDKADRDIAALRSDIEAQIAISKEVSERAELVQAIADRIQIMMVSASCYIDTEDDDVVTGYRIKTGSIHRIIGMLDGAGHNVFIPSNMPVEGATKQNSETSVERLPEYPKLKSAAELAYEKGKCHAEEGRKMTDDIYSTPELWKEYRVGYGDAQRVMEMNDQCQCRACLKGQTVESGFGPIPIEMTRMIVCAKCGNKRCPAANDHRNICTGSNEPGQKGSSYE